MLFENGLELKIGDPRLIRRAALSRHKNDFRDAETILDLLVNGRFPTIQPRSEHSQLVLQVLNYRHSLVGRRTSISNQLQAFARRKGLARFRIGSKVSRERLFAAAENETEVLLLNSRFSLFDELSREISAVEAELEKEADTEGFIKLLLTHSGVGRLTALALVHTLGDVRRFRKKEEVVAFVGLDPLERSSGEHKGSLLRFLLGQAVVSLRPEFLSSCDAYAAPRIAI